MRFWKHAAVALCTTVAFSGANAQTDGVSRDTIRIGMFAPLSGSAMSLGFDVANGAKMIYERVNLEGGIHGRKIEVVLEDDRCNANDLVAAVKKLVEQDKVFLLNGGSCSAATVAAREYIERSQIPLVALNAAVDAMVYPPSPYIYAAFAGTQHSIGGSGVAFATQHLKAKKIAYVAHDDAYGAWNMEAASFMAKRGGAELNVQQVAANINDVTAPMLKLKAGNPDALIVATYARGAAMFIKRAYELGFNKPIVLLVNGSSDLKQLTETVGTKDAFKNTFIQNNFSDLPGGTKLKWAYDLYAKTFPELAAKPGHPQAYMPQGIPSAMAVVAALKAAGPQPTRQKFLAEMEKLNLDTGVMAGRITFGPNDRVAMEHMTYARFDGAAMTAIAGSFASEWRYEAK